MAKEEIQNMKKLLNRMEWNNEGELEVLPESAEMKLRDDGRNKPVPEEVSWDYGHVLCGAESLLFENERAYRIDRSRWLIPYTMHTIDYMVHYTFMIERDIKSIRRECSKMPTSKWANALNSFCLNLLPFAPGPGDGLNLIPDNSVAGQKDFIELMDLVKEKASILKKYADFLYVPYSTSFSFEDYELLENACGLIQEAFAGFDNRYSLSFFPELEEFKQEFDRFFGLVSLIPSPPSPSGTKNARKV